MAPDYAEVTFLHAAVQALVGDPNEALQLLRSALESGYDATRARRDRVFESLRGLPEFESILSEALSEE